MLNHVRSWLYVDRLLRPVVVLDGLPGLYELKYDSATACKLLLYLYSIDEIWSAVYLGYAQGSRLSADRCTSYQ